MAVARPAMRDDLIAAFDAAVRLEDPDRVTAALRDELAHRTPCDDFRLPDFVQRPKPDGYARRLLYRSPDLGYTVVAMTWGPGQGTPVHDHCGMWCVEGVCCGEVEVVQYELMETDGDRCRLEPRGAEIAGMGAAGRLIPPWEYHTLTNRSESETAISLHVYAGDMSGCNVYLPDGDSGWYEKRPRRLCFDD